MNASDVGNRSSGLRPREELLVQDKYIVLEFPDARCLLAALQEFLKRAQRLFLYQAFLWGLRPSLKPSAHSCDARFEIAFVWPPTSASIALP